jgi:HK97 family phage major capsid protein
MASEPLKNLLEERDKAFAAYEAFAKPILEEKRDMTDDEKAARKELRRTVKTLDDRIDEIQAEEKRQEELAAARQAAGTVDVHVNSEPRTYGEGSPNSYIADLCYSAWTTHPQARAAAARLDRHAQEVAGEMRDPNSAEGKRARKTVAEWAREGSNRDSVKDAVERAATFQAPERRTGMDTTSGSGGSFVTPQYFVSDYAPYRQYGRAFADASHKLPLPDYGMTIYLPHVTAAAGVGAQSSQNSGITETDPTAGYLSVALTTNAGEVTVSQQLLDRAGPNFAFDTMVFDQLTRAYNLTLDVYVATQALANANSVTTSYSSFAWQTLAQKIAGGKSNIETTAGTVMRATHIWAQPSTWNFATAQVDAATNGTTRAAAVPTYAGPYNAWAAGNPSGAPEGDTGYRMFGLPVFTDANIPVDGSSHNQIVVTNQDEIWFWEGDLVTRAIPQTFAQNLSVLLQVYAYVGCIARYQSAVQTVSGSALNVTF